MTATNANRTGKPHPAPHVQPRGPSAHHAPQNAQTPGSRLPHSGHSLVQYGPLPPGGGPGGNPGHSVGSGPGHHAGARHVSGPDSGPSTAPFAGPESEPHDVPLAKRPLFTPKVVIWSMLGTVAGAYIATMLLAPALLDELTPTSAFITDPQSLQGQRVAARLVSDVSSLKESLSQIQLELSKVRTEVSTSSDRDNVMKAQILALEQRLAAGQDNTVGSFEPQADPGSRQRSVAAPDGVDGPAAQDISQNRIGSPQQPKLVNAEETRTNKKSSKETNLETGSVSQAEKASAKAAPSPMSFDTVVKPARTPVGIQISSGASVNSLRLSWSLLADRHATTLGKLEPRYVTRGDANDPTYDLVAGPIKSKSDAIKLCQSLLAKNVTCKVGDFAGAAL